jgi:hypothetical protein
MNNNDKDFTVSILIDKSPTEVFNAIKKLKEVQKSSMMNFSTILKTSMSAK